MYTIVGITTLSRDDHMTAQTREYECTRYVLPQVIARGLNVVEVAHDFQQQIRRYVVEDLKLVNSYDTWHGTKNVAKTLAKYVKGRRGNPVKDQLCDKRGSTKRHLYWCMKNCNCCPIQLRADIMNISKHYQNEHTNCHHLSPCHHPSYRPSKVLLTDPLVI